LKQVLATVISNDEIIPGGFIRQDAPTILGSRLIWLHCPAIAKEAKPGQFVMVRCGNLTLPRPFSIHQRNEKGNVALLYAVLEGGKGTNWLSQRCAGVNIELFGPLGNGFSIPSKPCRLLLVAGGNGIAPLFFLAQDAVKKGYTMTLIYGTANANRYPENLLPAEVRLISVTEDGSVGRTGRATDIMTEFIDQADQVFACGPMSMYKDMYKQRKRLLKDKPVQVSLEIMMGCGRGICYGCTIKMKQGLKEVCVDGPVFKLDDILWDELPQL
jgi:dihydroorotate dehydrogenase electron transfer subunit